MIKLYHAALTRSLRVLWLLEELGLPYEVEKVEFKRDVLDSPEFRRVNPLGRLPVLRDGDVAMIESGAMVQYLLERYGEGRLQPPVASPQRPAFLQWLHFAEAGAMPPIGTIAQHTLLKPEAERIAAVVPGARKQVEEYLGMLDQELAGKQFLLGDEFSAADVMLGYTLTMAEMLGILGAAHPNVQAYLGRLKQRPAYQKAMAA